jgi:hypothetical protein
MKNKMLIPALILLLAIVAGLVSAKQYIDGQDAQDRAEKAQAQAIKIGESLRIAQQELQESQREVINEQKASKSALEKVVTTQQEVISAQKRIDELQTESFRQVNGHGFPKAVFKVIARDQVQMVITTSEAYPLFRVSVVVTDPNKLLECEHFERDGQIFIGESCYRNTIIMEDGPDDLNGGVMADTKLRLTAGVHFLRIQFSAKNIQVVQFTFVNVDENNFTCAERIFEVARDGKMLQPPLFSHGSIDDIVWGKDFFLMKTINVIHSQ